MAELTDKQQALLEELLKLQRRRAGNSGRGAAQDDRQAALEAALEGELTHHLCTILRAAAAAIPATGALRSGSRASRVRWIWRFLGYGSFEPKIVEKRQRRVAGLDETIVYLYAQGQSTRAIQDTLKRLYGAEVSSTLVSEVTASVLEEVTAWQARPLIVCIRSCIPCFLARRDTGRGARSTCGDRY